MHKKEAGYRMCPVVSVPGQTVACEGAACGYWRWYQIYDIGGYEGSLSKYFGYCGEAGPQPGFRVYRKHEREQEKS